MFITKIYIFITTIMGKIQLVEFRGIVVRTFFSLIALQRGRRYLPRDISAKNVNLKSMVTFEPAALIENFQLPVTGILHVGANNGDTSPLYEAHSHVRVFAIEPVREIFKQLESKVSGLANVRAINVAIGLDQGHREINVASNGGQSTSFLEPWRHRQLQPRVAFERKEKVRVERLESVGLDESINFWIIDTQGTELEVLKSGSRQLDFADFIYLEVNRGETYRNCTRVQELDSYLGEHGFSRRLTRWFILWGDALYVRDTLELR
mgnify:CR=1 FL=1